MFRGRKLVASSNSIKGFTLIEMLIAMLLLIVIFLAVSALQVANYRFFLTAKDRVVIGYELQYSIQHIYEHVLVGTGDESDPPISIISNTEFTLNYIDKNDVGNSPKTCRYRIENGVLEFDRENDGTFDESLGSKVTFLGSDCEFSMDGDILRITLAAEFPLARAGTNQNLTMYSACYPRLASFR